MLWRNITTQVGILIDMDGTIVNSMQLLRSAFFNILRAHGIEVNAEIEDKVGNNLAEIMSVRSGRFTELRLIWRVLSLVESPLFKKIRLVFISYKKLRGVANSAPLIEGVDDAIKLLKADETVKIGIVTSRSKKDVISRLNKTSFGSLLDIILTRDDVTRSKPSSEQIILAAKRLNLSPRECAIIGDMPTDVEATKRVGAISIGVASGIFRKQLMRMGPDFVVHSIVDVPCALKEIIDEIRFNAMHA